MDREFGSDEYDLVIAGGGITGAGIFHEAVLRGYKTLLVEANDFAWGTSSRSSKMVHGGLRYLKQGKFTLTKSAVRERERLLKTYPGLVDPLMFMMPIYKDYGPSTSAMKIGLSIYSCMAGQRQYKAFGRADTLELLPFIRKEHLNASVMFKDAQVDDARLVLRLIEDGCNSGGTALNYIKVVEIHQTRDHDLTGVTVQNAMDQKVTQIKTKAVINATGSFVEALHPVLHKKCHIRPLRGSHLIFPRHVLPIDHVVSFIHPRDNRPVFIFPWQGCMVLGTTDVDHDQDLNAEPKVTKEEGHYLLEGVSHVLPHLQLSESDCIASMAGIRPVLSKSNKAASKESREHMVWQDKGLVSVTGGKLTTYRLLAQDALKAVAPFLPPEKTSGPKVLSENSIHTFPGLSFYQNRRLNGRYGIKTLEKLKKVDADLFHPIGSTPALWAEAVLAAREEKVCRLADLMLRRLRIGVLMKNGGEGVLDRLETLCKPYLGWSEEKWEKERKDYLKLWKNHYSPLD